MHKGKSSCTRKYSKSKLKPTHDNIMFPVARSCVSYWMRPEKQRPRILNCYLHATPGVITSWKGEQVQMHDSKIRSHLIRFSYQRISACLYSNYMEILKKIRKTWMLMLNWLAMTLLHINIEKIDHVPSRVLWITWNVRSANATVSGSLKR